MDQIDGPDPELFTIGCIGPDSRMLFEKWEHFDTRKKVSRFENREDVSDYVDLEFYSQHLQGVSPDEPR